MANAKATPRKFSMQGVFEILLRKPTDKSILAYLTDCKTTTFENTVEMVDRKSTRLNSSHTS